MHQLYLCSAKHDHYRALLEAVPLPELVLTDSLEDATIILGDPPKLAARIEKATQLKWLQSTYAGADALLNAPRRDYILTNVRGIFGPLMSEYVFGELLSLTRHLPHYREMQQSASWSPTPYKGLTGKTMVVLGTGSIGAHVASTARHFGMKTIGVSRSGHTIAEFDKVLKTQDMSSALANADVIVSILPSTQETKGILNKETLSVCQDAILFNVGRGPAVDEQGLLEAIDSGHIQHAVLDVFCQEPLPASHPFWQHPSISVTPHISAESFPEQVFDIFADNYRRWIKGEPLNYVMDFSLGY
ncbi:D-2-hydroxyacid dehydrogenase [Enterovibrio coralii]|uniref:2-ketoacid reductase n=1 Tax=Enterovibrio coralii TaxID=294935 RepID=A0A135I4N9_9GAMM|nr:D-2-hydroxyacid dehydrogenase [Enterovibrio coralii]KXF80384.1 2-ketoacid reductase [Enterovibrio coralii]